VFLQKHSRQLSFTFLYKPHITGHEAGRPCSCSEVESLITGDAFSDRPEQSDATGVKSLLVPREVLRRLRPTSAISPLSGVPSQHLRLPLAEQPDFLYFSAMGCCVQSMQLLAGKRSSYKTAINVNRCVTLDWFMSFWFSFWLLELVWLYVL